MKPLNQHLMTGLSLMTSALVLATPMAARAGTVTATTHTAASSVPTAVDDPSVDDGTLVDDPTNTADSADTTGDASVDPEASTTPETGAGKTLGKVTGFMKDFSDFFKNLMTYVSPILEFLTMINQYTHWFDGILGSGLGGVGGANGPMNGNTGTGIGSGTGTNIGRNTPSVPGANTPIGHGSTSTVATGVTPRGPGVTPRLPTSAVVHSASANGGMIWRSTGVGVAR